MKRDKKGLFLTMWTKDDIEIVKYWKKLGRPMWQIVNDLIGRKDGKVHHRTVYRFLRRLDE